MSKSLWSLGFTGVRMRGGFGGPRLRAGWAEVALGMSGCDPKDQHSPALPCSWPIVLGEKPGTQNPLIKP